MTPRQEGPLVRQAMNKVLAYHPGATPIVPPINDQLLAVLAPVVNAYAPNTLSTYQIDHLVSALFHVWVSQQPVPFLEVLDRRTLTWSDAWRPFTLLMEQVFGHAALNRKGYRQISSRYQHWHRKTSLSSVSPLGVVVMMGELTNS